MSKLKYQMCADQHSHIAVKACDAMNHIDGGIIAICTNTRIPQFQELVRRANAYGVLAATNDIEDLKDRIKLLETVNEEWQKLADRANGGLSSEMLRKANSYDTLVAAIKDVLENGQDADNRGHVTFGQHWETMLEDALKEIGEPLI